MAATSQFRRFKGSIGHTFTMCCPSQTAHLTMSSARIDPPKRVLGLKEGVDDEAFGYLKRVIVTPAVYPRLGEFLHFDIQSTGQKSHCSRSQSIPRLTRGGLFGSSSPPTVENFGTRTPEPSPQSQSFSRSYGSILPTSLAYIVPSTRGCSPWRPDAVMSTTGRERHSVLHIFKGHRECTGHHATCRALPAAGPYLRLSRFQGGQASAIRRVSPDSYDRLTHVQVPFTWNISLTTTKICTDGRSARARALLLIEASLLPRRPGIGWALQRHPFLGLVDLAGELWVLELVSSSSYPEVNFRGNQLLDGSISLSPLYPSETNDLHACSHSNPSQKIKVGRLCTLFQDGSNGEPTGRRPEQADAEARREARAADHDQGSDVSASTAPRGAIGSGHDGALTLSGAPFQGTWAQSVAEDDSPDYNSNTEDVRFSSWALPGSLAVTKGILVRFFSSAY
ncbi:hypothetical protein YC2023_066200 [Brassica napus]